jgi:uncharacterized protein
MNGIFVLDTNVLINALLSPKSMSSIVLRKALREGIVVYSDKTLNELEEKIHLPRFDKYVPLSRRLLFYNDFELNAFPIAITYTIKVCRDSKDDKFLELAKSAIADCIITKDADLLVLHPFESIPILNPNDFLRIF